MRNIFALIGLFATVALANFQLDSFQVYVDSVVPGARYGLSIRSVKTGNEIGNIRGGEKFTPASTLKTLTTAAAVHFLPLDYAPKTQVTVACARKLLSESSMSAVRAIRIFRAAITQTRSTCCIQWSIPFMPWA